MGRTCTSLRVVCSRRAVALAATDSPCAASKNLRCAVRGRTKEQESIAAGASGYRDVGSGAMSHEGSSGYYWSASLYDATTGSYLDFYSGSVATHRSSPRGNGFPLRCIQEFALRGAGPDGRAREYSGRSFGLPRRPLGHGGLRGQRRLLLVSLVVQCYLRVQPALHFGPREPAIRLQSWRRVPPALHPRICAARCRAGRKSKRV